MASSLATALRWSLWSFLLVASWKVLAQEPFDLQAVREELPASDSAYLASSGPSPELAFLLSAAVPGAGQLYAGKKRGYLYLLAEGALWTGYLLTRRDAQEKRDAYLREVRAGVNFDGVGSFETWNEEDYEHATLYDNWHNVYNDQGGVPVERVGKWYWKDREAFKDADPELGEAIPPSTLRQRALQLRNESNDRFKTARTVLGIVVFHHLFSAIEARITTKRLARSLADSGHSVRLALAPDSAQLLWSVSFGE
ncbi:MAG: hypothetical protein KatS3mg115_0814 [Candidatus Poribacteria bacterium]|nr:MAG: hypothetical protein KatS3mg115_0814 [Candidatus Poribacteria bacterium]